MDKAMHSEFEGHTPGPWDITLVDDDDTIEVFHTDDGPGHYHTICTIEQMELDIPEDQVMPNAKLIAASPTMYAFIKRLATEGNDEAQQFLKSING